MIRAFFDMPGFIEAIDQVRQARGLSWGEVYHQTGINLSILKKMREGKQHSCSLQTLTTLVLWSGLDVRGFMLLDTDEQKERRPARLLASFKRWTS